MSNSLVVLFVINLFQVFAAPITFSTHHVLRRSPQQIDIQSIRQKQVSPDITVVDVVVNEPTRRRYPDQNQYIQPTYQPGGYPRGTNNFNYYPNRQYPNVPNRRQPEIQIIEVIDPTPGTRQNIQPWQRYPNGNQQRYPEMNQGQIYPNYPGRFPPNQGNRPGNGQFIPPGHNRRPYRPNPDFHTPEDSSENDNSPPRPPHGNRRPGHHHRHRPRPHKNSSNESSEEERYVFDAEEKDSAITGYTNDNFPIIPLNKNDIRR